MAATLFEAILNYDSRIQFIKEIDKFDKFLDRELKAKTILCKLNKKHRKTFIAFCLLFFICRLIFISLAMIDDDQMFMYALQILIWDHFTFIAMIQIILFVSQIHNRLETIAEIF